MTSNAKLREGCIFDSKILAGQIGCPNTKQCDNWTGQPMLVTENNYLPCPPELKGCPPRNHSGYSILKIYKYPRCQGKNISDESSVSSTKTTDTVPNTPARITRDRNLIIIVICIIILVIIGSATAFIFHFRDKLQGCHQQSGSVVKEKSNANSPESNEIFYTYDRNVRSSIHSLEGHSKDMDIKYVVVSEDVDCTVRAVNTSDIIGVQYCKQNNPGKERAQLQLPTGQQSYQVKQESLQTSLPDVTIETEHQDNSKGFVKSRDLDTGYVVYDANSDFTTAAVHPLYVNGVLSDPIQNNCGNEKIEFQPSARQLCYQINEEISQRSSPDITNENENQDNIEDTVVLRGLKRKDLQEVSQGRRISCSSSGSDNSHTPMLKETSKTNRPQTIRNLRSLSLSPQTLPKKFPKLAVAGSYV